MAAKANAPSFDARAEAARLLERKLELEVLVISITHWRRETFACWSSKYRGRTLCINMCRYTTTKARISRRTPTATWSTDGTRTSICLCFMGLHMRLEDEFPKEIEVEDSHRIFSNSSSTSSKVWRLRHHLRHCRRSHS